MKTLTKQNIIDILYGCTVLGTGGGGNLEEGLAMMEQDFQGRAGSCALQIWMNCQMTLILPTPYGCGAPPA